MQDKETTPRKRRRVTLFRVIMVLLLIAGCAFAIYRLRLRSKLNVRIEAIRAAGYPATYTELDKWYAIPDDAENAAYTIEEAFSFYKEWGKKRSKSLLLSRADLPARTEPLAEETKTLIAQYIADNSETLDLFHEAAEIENCRYRMDLSGGFYMRTPTMIEIRGGVLLLRLEGILHAENGDGRSAIRSAISVFGMARSLAREPITSSQLSRASYQSVAIWAVEQIINRIELTDEQLVELIESVRESERISDISCALVGERCTGISFFRAPKSVSPDVPGGGGPLRRYILALYKALGLADADAVIYLDLMDEYLKAAQLPPHERQEAVKAVDARLLSTSQAHILLHEIMPVLSRIITLETRAIARLRIAGVALAIQRYRLAAGALPEKLADIVPAYLDAVPKDPFDGNDLRYKKLDPGFVVYSIGEDLSDDGGRERLPRSKSTGESPNWDVTFIVER